MKELKRLKKEIMVLGIPILIEQILTTTMGMMNTMLSSNLEGDVGIHVVSAISMIDSFSYLFQCLQHLLWGNGCCRTICWA